MNDEIQDGFNRLKELADKIRTNLQERRINLAEAQFNVLMNNIDVLEAELKLNDEQP